MEHIVFSFTAGPWWAYTLFVLVGALIATVSYQRTMPELDSATKSVLIGLRTLGIALLLIALFEPVLRLVRSTEHQPVIAIAIDESRSVTIGASLQQRKKEVLEVVERLRSAFDDAVIVGYSGTARPLADLDSIKFDGERTDPSRAIRMLANQPVMERPALVVMLSDGNANTGEQPLSVAEASGLGFYTIGIGDTTSRNDVVVQSLFTPGIVVVDRQTTVVGRIHAVGLKGTPIEVLLEEEGKVVAKDTVIPATNTEWTTTQLPWTPMKAGPRNIRVRSKAVVGEFSTANNTVQDLVDVRSNKRTIVVFAGAPSPDVSFVTQILQRDPTVTVKTFVQKQGGTFYGNGPVPADMDGAEACVLIGFPIASTSESTISLLQKRAANGLSTLFISSKDVDYSKLGALSDVLPFKVAATRPTEFLVTPDIRPGAMADPILKITGSESDATLWETVPPIYRTETFVTPTPGARTLATIRVNNIPMDEPLIMTRESGASRSMAVLGYGLYRWKLLGEGPQAARGEDPISIFETFIGNSVSWLSVQEDERRIRIRSTQRIYAAGESVAFEASVLDQTFTPVDGATVTVVVTTLNGKRTLTLAGIGGGRYSSSLGPLPAGSYTFEGTVTSNDARIGSDNGRFLVGDLGLEDAALNINVAGMRAIAERTGGQYSPVNGVDSLIEAMKADPRLQPKAITTERDTTLWHTPWPLALAILAFAAEWFIRKRRGLV